MNTTVTPEMLEKILKATEIARLENEAIASCGDIIFSDGTVALSKNDLFECVEQQDKLIGFVKEKVNYLSNANCCN